MRRKPRPRIVCRMPRGQPIKLTTHLIFSVPDFFFVVAIFRAERLGNRSPFLPSLAKGFRPLCRIVQMKERVESGLDYVVRVRSAQRFREHVRDARNLHHCSHWTARNYARAFWGRLQNYLARATAATQLMRN